MATTKTSGLGDNFYIAGFDLSGDLAAIDKISGGPATLEGTSIKQLGVARLFGLRDGSISFTTLFENVPAIATPAFPASTVPVTNTTGFPVLVTITGGTLTNVLVNGASVGTTAGTYAVPVGGTISVTYTVLPAWNWFALGAEHNALKTPITSADVECMYFRGTLQGTPAACMNSKQTSYDPTRDAQGNLNLKCDLVANAFGVEWGVQLTAGLRTDIAATNGTALDQGNGFVTPAVPASGVNATNTSPLPASVVISAGTLTQVNVNGVQVGTGDGTYLVPPAGTINVVYSVAPTWVWTLQTTFGAQGYMQLVDIVGTNVDIAIQHSPDNATWTSLIDFGSQTAIGGFRGSVSNVTTINRYLRVVTTGTFSFATFAVALNRNQIAGVAF